VKRIFKPLFVSLLSFTLILVLPLAAIGHANEAVPLNAAKLISDDPLQFNTLDLTPSLETAVGERGLSEVTALCVIENYNLALIVGAIDNNGNAMLWKWSRETWTDLSHAVSGLKTINALCWMIDTDSAEYLCIGGDDGTKATLNVLNLGTNNVTTASNEGYSTITSIAYDWRDAMGLAVTFGPSGFALLPGPSSGSFDIVGGETMAAAANAIAWPSANGPYFLTGTHSGTILEYGAGFGDSLATLPGVVDITDLNPMSGMDFQLAAGMGADGYAKLFKLNPAGEGTATGTGVNLPRTITGNPKIGWVPPYALIGGNGGIGHLYKWRQASEMFINYDYMISGMNRINCVTSFVGPPGFYVVGGSGSQKLVLISGEQFADVVSPTDPSDWVCGDGTATVHFPENAVDVGYNAIIEKVASGTPPAPGGLRLLGSSYDFVCFDGDGQPITEFNQPVTITIHYSDADLGDISEDSLQIFWYNTATGAWEAVTPCTVDKVNNTVTFQTTHFSQFAILGMTALPNTGN
jgi:hypothetical protein